MTQVTEATSLQRKIQAEHIQRLRRLGALPKPSAPPKPNNVIPLVRPKPICDRQLALADLVIMTGGETEPLPAGKAKIKDIQQHICRSFGVDMNGLLSPRRANEVCIPRQVGMMLCRALTTRSYPEIGRRFGGRDHTTVMHACAKYEWLRVRLKGELDLDAPLSCWTNRAAKLVQEPPKCAAAT